MDRPKNENPHIKLPVRLEKNHVILDVRVTPNSKRDAVETIEYSSGDAARLRVRTTAVPDKGKANLAVTKLLSKEFEIPKSAIKLIKGETSRNKTFALEGADFSQITGRLKQICTKQTREGY